MSRTACLGPCGSVPRLVAIRTAESMSIAAGPSPTTSSPTQGVSGEQALGAEVRTTRTLALNPVGAAVAVTGQQELATWAETNASWPVSGQLANGQVSDMSSGQTKGDLTVSAGRIGPGAGLVHHSNDARAGGCRCQARPRECAKMRRLAGGGCGPHG